MNQYQYDLMILEYWKKPTNSVSDLYNEILLSKPYSVEDQIRLEENIVKFYFKLIKLHNRFPYFCEVLSEVETYNYEIFTQIAFINISENNDVMYLTPEKYEEMIGEEADSIAEMFYQYDCANMECAVAAILNENKLTYYSDGDDTLFDYIEAELMIDKMSALEKNTDIIINDCQTIMFNEMLEYGFTTNSGELYFFNNNRNSLVTT
ncbi:MAG: hypothetical protein N2749_00920 [Clostridia bacterium]|nr:hypothetical protein [Clostridia bacterium]